MTPLNLEQLDYINKIKVCYNRLDFLHRKMTLAVNSYATHGIMIQLQFSLDHKCNSVCLGWCEVVRAFHIDYILTHQTTSPTFEEMRYRMNCFMLL